MRELILILLMGLVVGCMPDSFTKFNDSTKAGGGVGGAPSAPPVIAPKLMSTPLSKIQHLVHSQDLLLLYVSNVSSFSVGGFVSTPNGFVAVVKEKNVTNNFLKVQVCGTGVDPVGLPTNRCNAHDSGYPTVVPTLGLGSSISGGINGDIISSNASRLSESSLDNSISYFTEKTKITKIVFLIPTVSPSITPFHLTPIANIKSSQESELSGFINSPISNPVTGTGTSFLTEVKVNDLLIIEGQVRRVTSILNNLTLTVSSSFNTVFTTNTPYSVSSINTTDYLTKIITTTFSPDLTLVNLYAPDSLTSKLVGELSNYDRINLVDKIPNRTLAETKVTLTMTDADFNKASSDFFIQSDTAVTPKNTPLKLTKTQYLAPKGTRMILNVGSTTSFSVNGVVSNASGFLGNITYIDSSKNQLYVTVCGLNTTLSTNSRCNATVPLDTYAADGAIISADSTRISESNIDNSTNFISKKTNVTKVTFIYENGLAGQPTLFAMPNIRSSAENELSGLVYTTGTTNISGVGTKFKSEINELDQILVQGVLRTVQTINSDTSLTLSAILPTTLKTNTNFEYQVSQMKEADYINTANFTNNMSPVLSSIGLTDLPSPTGNGKAELLNTNPISNVIPETIYTLTQTDILGNTASTSVNILTDDKPSDLSVSRNAILEVPSDTAFSPGDIVTNASGASGIVLRTCGIRTVLCDMSTSFIDVKITKGVFTSGEDIDNTKIFASQKTYISGEVIPYNVRIKATTPTKFVKNEIISGGATGKVAYKSDAVATAPDEIYLLLSSGQITSGITNLISGTSLTDLVTQVYSNQQIVTKAGAALTVVPGNYLTALTSGLGDVTSVLLNDISVNSVSPDYFVGNLNTTNPYTATTTTLASSKSENYYMFYKNRPGTLNFQVNKGTGIVYSISPSLPNGLVFDTVNGTISGTPLINSTKTSYTITATNAFGPATTTFSLKIDDYFDLTETQNVFSYNLHRGGKGYSSTPCRISADQISNGINSDIVCMLEAGEDQLFELGAKLQVEAGNNICQSVKFSPYYFYNQLTGSSTNTNRIKKSTGSFTDPACVDNYSLTTSLPYEDFGTLSSDDNFCRYDYSKGGNVIGAPNCDSGTIKFDEYNYTVVQGCAPERCTGVNKTGVCTGFVATNESACIAGSGTWAYNNTSARCLAAGGIWNNGVSLSDQTVCEDKFGNCFYGPESSRSTCEATYGACSPTTAGATKTACEDPTQGAPVAAGTWTPTANAWRIDNSINNAPFQNICNQSAATPTTYSCGGDATQCISSAGSKILATPLTSASKQFVKNPYINGTPQSFTLNSPQSEGKLSNTYIANYSEIINTKFKSVTDEYNLDLGDPLGATALNKRFYNYWDKSQIDDPFQGGQPFYEFSCLDGFGTVKARIKLMIRDWNSQYKISDQIDLLTPINGVSGITDGSAGPPFIATAEKMDLSAYDIFSNPYDAYKDWDSFAKNSAGTVPLLNTDGTRGINTAITGGCTIVLGSTTLTCGGANFDTVDIVVDGTVLLIGTDTYTVKSKTSTTVLELTSPYIHDNATPIDYSGAVNIVHGFPFPGDNL